MKLKPQAQAPKRRFSLPLGHQAFMVSEHGFSCTNCAFLKSRDEMLCGEPNFVRWNGSERIPVDSPEQLDHACSDWFEPK